MSRETYVLGSSPEELSRLTVQARIIRPITQRLLVEAGVKKGMRVLDLGCGAGDSSMLVADMVGPLGTVIAIDRSQAAIDKAESRAREEGYTQIQFLQNTVDEFSSEERFDLVMGRYVLIHQLAPADFIRAARRHIRPGGVLAFHELTSNRRSHSLPESPLFQRMATLVQSAVTTGFACSDAAGRLVEFFQGAGLSEPKLFSETPISGGSDPSLCIWMAELIRSLMPSILERGLATAEEISVETLEERLIYEVRQMRSQVEIPSQVCAWTRV